MQPRPASHIGNASTSVYETEKDFSKDEQAFPTSVEVALKSQVRDDTIAVEIVQQLQAKGLQGKKERRKPSPTAWHFMLISGDSLLLLVLFGLSVYFRLLPQAPASIFGSRGVKLILLCFALGSWGFAVHIAQSQHIIHAAGRLKSVCCAIFALFLTTILCLVLSSLLLGIEFLTATRLAFLFFVLAIPLFVIWRILFATIMNAPHFRTRAVIAGVNPSGETIATELQCTTYPTVNVLGYIGQGTEEGSSRKGLPILGGRSVLRYLLYNNLIDTIIVALDSRDDPDLFREAVDAAKLGVAVLPMTVIYESMTGKVPVEHIGDQWYVALQSERTLSSLYLCWKKALDLAFGMIGLLVLGAILPFLAFIIALDSPGPIFYSQERIGFRGKPFRIYKFRSMYTDAERGGKAQWAAKHDSRITRVGRFMRATHLDEFPQVLNILRGEMSLIGPRPEREEFTAKLEETIPFYRRRLAAKPGLTGWAQIMYRYGRTDNDTLIKLQYDLYYIKRQSFMLDLLIILKTIAEVLSLRGGA